jgi:hypothetical protein
MNVRFNSELISYDKIQRKFEQEVFVKKPTNITVDLDVSDSSGAKETYSFKIVFDCSDPFVFN